ncbi:MAG: DAK2 domain-containing protein [Clostridia bacterium]|nr:DAK2 domain-containing protein [Clostridia bacterium]
MKVTSLNGKLFKEFISGGFENLKVNKDKVNALNVFPVPDGDTGTNMLLTVQSAVKETEQVSEVTLAKICTAVSKGSFMGARGNSGVILSQIFRGIAHELGQHEDANPIQVAQALQTGVETAYKAVMKPVEGTILTVVKECAREALIKAKSTDDVAEILEAALAAGERALAFTPEQLPVLKQAGVVDAGGKGLLVILEGGIKALRGNYEFIAEEMGDDFIAEEPEIKLEDITFLYCTELLISGESIPAEQIQKELDELGDSLLVVGTSEMVKIHIHTNKPGIVLDKSSSYGELHDININNMMDQHLHQQTAIRSKHNSQLIATKQTGVVAIANGPGIIEMLQSMGVDQVVTCGQTMNPSTEDILAAIELVPARKVIILPNNKNIFLAANQAKELCEIKEIEIVPTKNFPQALVAMLVYDDEMELDLLAKEMTERIGTVKAGEVTYAIRDSQFNGLEIKEGEIIGLLNDEICCGDKSVDEVVKKLLEKMVDGESELVTLFYGKNVEEEQANNLMAELKKNYPNQEFETYKGGQQLYFYIIAVE